MTAVPRQIDVHPQPVSRRAAGREERGGEAFTSALGAREEGRAGTAAGGSPAGEAPSADGSASGDKAGDVSPDTSAKPDGGSVSASGQGSGDLAAMLAAFETTPRSSPAADAAGAEARIGATAGDPVAARKAMAADLLQETGQMPGGSAGLPDDRDAARMDLFRRLDATASTVFDGDAAPLRFAAQGQSAPGSHVRADFVSMRTDFAPASRGGDGAVAAGRFAARMAAPGRAVADGAVPAGTATLLGADASADAGAAGSSEATPGDAKGGSPSGAQGAALDADGADVAKAGSSRTRTQGEDTGRNAAATADFPVGSSDPAGPADAPVSGTTPLVPPARQVASALVGALADLRPVPAGAETAANLKLRAGGAALKTVQIQLQPAHFGKVDVTLKLIDGQLAIQLLASEPETVMRLKDDTEALKSLLSQSGFAVDDAAISIGLRDPGPARGAFSPGHADNTAGGGAADGQAAHGGGTSRNESGGQQGPAGQGSRNGDAPGGNGVSSPGADAGRRLDRSVYL
ncbi:flagellar hook-length control protein FliK [Aurantimonas sp. HBX-1]|uniref:flagellar hook-length control protein FliK n=1 Tax=Aurantimonas sp. HBX-1 TaxID=2906072 RepID=UPI001F469DEC|nr:flagellar hook-length control protein FliK [Aurantimonas sp. HBX-1]UIJ72888.1 flagellar hook-length control protein FliK [Aurantimonas sp. HBX-1]